MTFDWRSPARSTVLVCLLGAICSIAEAQTLPAGWTAGDVGNPAVQGSASFSGDTYTVSGAGADVWGAADQFFFLHRQLTGDGTIVARVAGVEGADVWTKAGVMMRESLDAGSRHAFALVSRGKGMAFQRRAATSGSSVNTSAAGAAPNWVKVERKGSSFTASRSADGVTWTVLASHSIVMPATIFVGLAVTSHDVSALARATFTDVAIDTPALPAGWSSSDVGPGVLPGSAGHASGVYTIEGAGRDIWGTSDEFRFAYLEATGDVDVVARVDSIEQVDQWTKAGVMIRGSLGAGSAHASMFVSPGKGLAFQRRPANGATSVHTSGGSGTAPRWVKLSRRGSSVTAYQSGDGVAWTLVGSQTLALPATFYAGLAVSSHRASVLATVRFSGVSVQPAVPAGNQAPTVSLTSPASGASFVAPASVTLAATAADADGTVSRVDFYAGATLVGTDVASPYEVTWTGVPAGTYSLSAVAWDDRGSSTTSALRSITVAAPNQSPYVILTSPVSGAVFTAPAVVALTATATDADGTIARVDFYNGTTLLGTDTTAPYAFDWSSVAAGSYSVTAVARDNAGATTVSGSVSVTVSAPQTPSLAVFAPSSSHDTAVDRYVVEFFHAGADPTVSNPVSTADIGKPTIVNGECQADVSQMVNELSPGLYIGTVTAMGPGGSTRSAASPEFAR